MFLFCDTIILSQKTKVVYTKKGKTNKKYNVIFYNYLAQENQILYILVNNEEETAIILKILMKGWVGNRYTKENIKSIMEIEDNYYLDLNVAKEQFKRIRGYDYVETN